ncbi:MAG: diphosphomevalonate decarboxylase [Bradymonadaceae bacterium]|nr:diphosphomevalonate decarboxylase [Lujinxingiaceae bacterium]
MTKATALAHPNIALVKYWGKRDQRLNLPASASLSLTLAGMETRTSVEFDEALEGDLVELNGVLLTHAHNLQRVTAFLDRVREMSGRRRFARVQTHNNFPTSAGLASSASAFAALALAASAAADLELSASELSVLARLGSGSAARSIFGGFAEMKVGHRPDGQDSFAVGLADEAHWDLRCLVAITAHGEKAIGSTDGMLQTMSSSPYYDPWIAHVPGDIEAARQAIAARDFEALGVVAERSCLRMHASALAADPGILYWNPTTVRLIHGVRLARAQGLPVFFTIDAGPHVKVFCPANERAACETILRDVEGVLDVLSTRPGPGAHLLDERL